MAPSPTNADIMHKLGGVEAELAHASQSRGVIHQRLEEQGKSLHEVVVKMTEVATNLMITSEVAIQARNEILGFKSEFVTQHLPEIKAATTFQTEAEPILKVMRVVRNIVIILAGTGVVTAAGVVGLLIFARDLLATLVRALLGI